VDGLFISPVYRLRRGANLSGGAGTPNPTVLIGPPAPFCKSFVSVEIDEQVASYTATQHLLKLGHKRIAYLTGSPTHRGYTSDLKATAAPCAKPDWTWTTSWFFRPATPLKMAPKPRCKC